MGSARMGKSLGNYIGVTEPPEEIYGKTLSIPDTSLADVVRVAAGPTGCPRTCLRGTPSERWPASSRADSTAARRPGG